MREGSLSAWFMESISPWPWLYAEAGLRGDHFGFDVADRLHPEGDSHLDRREGCVHVQPQGERGGDADAPGTDIYLNYGEGFHSNDARGVTPKTDPARPLTKARGYEAGARTRLFDRLDLAASLWKLDLDGELVWVGDGGGTEENGPTRTPGRGPRSPRPHPALALGGFGFDQELMPEYVKNAGNGTAVALAPRLTWTGGLSMRHPSGFFGSLRGQHLDDRPADEAGNFHRARLHGFRSGRRLAPRARGRSIPECGQRLRCGLADRPVRKRLPPAPGNGPR